MEIEKENCRAQKVDGWIGKYRFLWQWITQNSRGTV
jgi:hypothetical protein